MEPRYKRVNVMIGEDQHDAVTAQGLNLSGLVRDLLGDHLSQSKITIAVSEETRQIYDMVVSNTDSTDREVEVYLREALTHVLERNITRLKQVHAKLVAEQEDR